MNKSWKKTKKNKSEAEVKIHRQEENNNFGFERINNNGFV
jgi:hypothetical protein